MKTLFPGRMDKRIRIEIATEGPVDGNGQIPKSWSTHLRTRANIRMLSGSEATQAQQIAAKTNCSIVIPFPKGLDPMPNPGRKMRIVSEEPEGKLYDITSARPMDEVDPDYRRESYLQIRAYARSEAEAA